jgi:hypothetical protein
MGFLGQSSRFEVTILIKSVTLLGPTKRDLVVSGRLVERDKGKFSGRKSKSKGTSKSLVQSTRRCWKCDKVGHYKKNCKSRAMEVSKRKKTSDKGGDVYLASTST